MLTKKDISSFRTELENTKYGEDFMTEFLKKESVRYLKQLEEKLGEKEAGQCREKDIQKKKSRRC